MSQAGLSICPMPVGAEVVGLVAGTEANPAIRASLYDAWLQHGILLFRNIDSIERHLTLSRCFGELEIHPFAPVRSELNPMLIEIGGKKRPPAYVFDGHEIRCNRIAWHRDTAYTPDICKGAMLRMIEVPARHGETMFADMAMAYDDLPTDVKARLETLEYKATLSLTPIDQTGPGAFWKTVRRATPEEDSGGNSESSNIDVKSLYPSVVHPAVLTHPEWGRKCIFLSPTYVDFFLGMDQAESDALLDYLVTHMLRPRYVYTHRWAINDAMLWDNRRFMHAGRGNEPDDPRWGLRTTLAGPVRTGRYFEDGVQASIVPTMAD
jgi:alpha-ketoglutarate-dependent taurine dioxygenase